MIELRLRVDRVHDEGLVVSEHRKRKRKLGLADASRRRRRRRRGGESASGEERRQQPEESEAHVLERDQQLRVRGLFAERLL